MNRSDDYKLIAQSAYRGTCGGCGDPYEVGDPIWWRRGGPCFHEDCEPDAAEAQAPPAGGTRAATASERLTGAEHALHGKLHALAAQVADAERERSACVRAVAALVRAVVALADELGAGAVVAEPLAEVETALRSLTDPHADAAAAAAAPADGPDGAVPF